MNEKRIKLNVGGIFYETTKTTLLSANGDSNYFSAYLSRMEKNQGNNIQEKEGIELFIDRNGFLFQYILDYLRTGTIVTIPDKDHIIKGLLIEADFYLLESLTCSLRNKLQEQSMNKLNSNINWMITQSQSQSQCQSQNQSQNLSQCQSQILTQSQSQSIISDSTELSMTIMNDTYKKDFSSNSYIANNMFVCCYNTGDSIIKENDHETENNYLKFEFSLNEDF